MTRRGIGIGLIVLFVLGLAGAAIIEAQTPASQKAVKAAFLKAPEAAKLAAWRSHIMKAERAGTWTAEQKAVFTLALSALKPGVYAKKTTEQRRSEPAGLVGALARTHFPVDVGRRIFASLEEADLRAANISGFGIILARLEARAYPACDCSVESDWCGDFCGPITPPAYCAGTVGGGCGTFWQWACDGMCGGVPFPDVPAGGCPVQ